MWNVHMVSCGGCHCIGRFNLSPNRGKQDTILDLTRLYMQFQAEKRKAFKLGDR